MQTIHTVFSASLEEKKSTFLAYLCPIDMFDALHVKLKNEHPKEVHQTGQSVFLMNIAKSSKTIPMMVSQKVLQDLPCHVIWLSWLKWAF